MVESYHKTITSAISDLSRFGYDSPERISYWSDRLREAANLKFGSSEKVSERLRNSLTSVYRRLVDQGSVLKRHPGVDKFVFDRITPLLHNELTQRVVAAEDLVRSNREEVIERLIHHFKSWSTSIPRGGSPINKIQVRKSFSNFSFEDSFLTSDQSRKLASSLSAIVAHEGEALVGEWHSNWRLPGYLYRQDHKERDLEFYPIRGNWALSAGLMKRAGQPFLDEIEQVGEWPACRCWMKFIYSLSDLPKEFLTRKGESYISSA